ncbi:MAG: hypothetical protein GXO22_09045 [Aquificae bacterium]|nr:hypothetical protein [Aquificota bacterium]
MKLFWVVIFFFSIVLAQENDDNLLKEEARQYLISVIPPYNSVYFAGEDFALVLQKISNIKWKENYEFEQLAKYYANLYIGKSACFEAVYYKKTEFSYEEREKLRTIKSSLKAMMFDNTEKYKRFVLFNKLISGKTYSIVVVTDENLDKIISKYCQKGVKDYLKLEEVK